MNEFTVTISSRACGLGALLALAGRGETVVVRLLLENKLCCIGNDSVLDKLSKQTLHSFGSQSLNLPFKADDYEDNKDDCLN